VDPRKLKRLLDTYRACGVDIVRMDDKLQPTYVRFAPALAPVPTGDVEGAEQDWTAGAPMGLQRQVERIQKAYEAKPAKGRAS
jgi:hypothetical protein